MAELKVPNLNRKSDKYLFKKKLTLSRKSKRKLLSESFFMFFLSSLLIYLNYLIPNKKFLFANLTLNFEKLIFKLFEISKHLNQILLVIFILSSLIIAIVLILGSFYRILRVVRRKTKSITYR